MTRGVCLYKGFWEFDDSITVPVPQPCFICGADTHRIDICYEAPLHRHCEAHIGHHLEILALSQKDSEFFAEALINPPGPCAELKQAMENEDNKMQYPGMPEVDQIYMTTLNGWVDYMDLVAMPSSDYRSLLRAEDFGRRYLKTRSTVSKSDQTSDEASRDGLNQKMPLRILRQSQKFLSSLWHSFW